MKLLTKEIEKKIPPLYSTENTPLEEKKIAVKFFDPCGSWTWYAVEASAVTPEGEYKKLTECPENEREDVIFFGLVDGFEKEWGNFSLNELKSVKGPLGLGIERDLYFDNKTIADVK
jgi:hypothetical protein